MNSQRRCVSWLPPRGSQGVLTFSVYALLQSKWESHCIQPTTLSRHVRADAIRPYRAYTLIRRHCRKTLLLTNRCETGYNKPMRIKSCEKKSTSISAVQRARGGGSGYGGAEEHGLGAGGSIGRPRPGAPVTAPMRQIFLQIKVVPRKFTPLGFPRGVFHFQGGCYYVRKM